MNPAKTIQRQFAALLSDGTTQAAPEKTKPGMRRRESPWTHDEAWAGPCLFFAVLSSERKDKTMKTNSTRNLTHAALVAAIYMLLTIIFRPISFGAVQFRVAEALTLLPILMADAVPGLFVGCLLANLLGGGIWYDVVLGSVATLLAAVCTRKFRTRPLLAAAMPVLFNGAIVGPLVYLAYVRPQGTPIDWTLMWSSVGTVALGEAVVCYTLGLLLVKALRHVPEKYLGN